MQFTTTREAVEHCKPKWISCFGLSYGVGTEEFETWVKAMTGRCVVRSDGHVRDGLTGAIRGQLMEMANPPAQ